MPDSSSRPNRPDRSHPQVSNRYRSRISASEDEQGDPPATADDAVRKRLEWFASWSDDVFRIPGTQIRVGLEPLIGLIPGVGDAASLIVSAYVPVEAWRQGAPASVIANMLAAIAVDAIAGSVPVVGDLFDVTYRANRRNANRLLKWMDESRKGSENRDAP
jgi:hypothetical protein